MDVRVLQISDTHLFSLKDGRIKGVNSFQCLERVLAKAFDTHKQIDFVVLTGDLSQDETVESYTNLAELIAPYHAQIFYIPGNHDDKGLMKQVFDPYSSLLPGSSLDLGDWTFVFLDTALEGRAEGVLSEFELRRLVDVQDHSRANYLAIFLHHNPVTMDPRRVDPMMLTNAESLLEVLDERVKAVVCGHVHQGLVQSLGGIDYIASPSTCVQFCPTASGLTIDNKAPGYRYLEFHSTGQVETSVYRLDEVPEGLYQIDGDL